MNNKLKPEEMFVMALVRYAVSLLSIITDSLQSIDARGALESTKAPDSPFCEKRKQAALRQTPAAIIAVAIQTVDDYLPVRGHDLLTRAVLEEQMKSIGMDPGSFLTG